MLPSPVPPDRFRPRPPRRRLFLGVPDPSAASSADASADAAVRSSGCASSRWLSGVCSGSFTAAPLRLRPPRVPWRRRPSSAPSSVRPSVGSAASVPVSSCAVPVEPPRPRPPRPRPPRLRRRGACGASDPPASAGGPSSSVFAGADRRRGGAFSVSTVRCPAPRGPAGRSVGGWLGLAPRGRLPRLVRGALRRSGGRLARRIRRTLEDRGEPVRGRRLARRRLGLSIHGYSLRSERGGGPDPARTAVDARSFAMNVPSPAQRRSPRAGLMTCSYNCRSCPGPRRLPGDPRLGPPAASRATSLASSPITSGASRLPALMGHVCASRIAVPCGPGGSDRGVRASREGQQTLGLPLRNGPCPL